MLTHTSMGGHCTSSRHCSQHLALMLFVLVGFLPPWQNYWVKLFKNIDFGSEEEVLVCGQPVLFLWSLRIAEHVAERGQESRAISPRLKNRKKEREIERKRETSIRPPQCTPLLTQGSFTTKSRLLSMLYLLIPAGAERGFGHLCFWRMCSHFSVSWWGPWCEQLKRKFRLT